MRDCDMRKHLNEKYKYETENEKHTILLNYKKWETTIYETIKFSVEKGS